MLVSRFSLVSCGHTLLYKTRLSPGTGEELYTVLVEAQERPTQEQGYLHVATQFKYLNCPSIKNIKVRNLSTRINTHHSAEDHSYTLLYCWWMGIYNDKCINDFIL